MFDRDWDPGAHRNFTIRGESYGDGKLGELSGDLRINYLITSSIEFQSKGVGNGDTIGLFRIWLSFRSSEWMRNPEDQAQSLRGRTGNILQMEKEQIWIRWGQQKLSKKIELEALLRVRGKRRRRRKRGCASLCFQLLVDTTPSLLKCLCRLANGYKLNRASTGVVVLSKWKKRVPHTRNSYPSLNCLWIVGVLKTAMLRVCLFFFTFSFFVGSISSTSSSSFIWYVWVLNGHLLKCGLFGLWNVWNNIFGIGFWIWFILLSVCDHNRRVGILEAVLFMLVIVLKRQINDLALVCFVGFGKWLTTEHNVLVVSTRDLWLVSLNQSQMVYLVKIRVVTLEIKELIFGIDIEDDLEMYTDYSSLLYVKNKSHMFVFSIMVFIGFKLDDEVDLEIMYIIGIGTGRTIIILKPFFCDGWSESLVFYGVMVFWWLGFQGIIKPNFANSWEYFYIF